MEYTTRFPPEYYARADRLIETYPRCESRVESGLIIAGNGGVEVEEDGWGRTGWLVRSSSHPDAVYRVSAGPDRLGAATLFTWHCTCPDCSGGYAPHGFCKHILAVWILTGEETG